MPNPRVSEQPPVGTTRLAPEGRVWRKVRRLSDSAWEEAVVAAHSYMRVGEPVPDSAVRAMGYEEVGRG